MFLFQTAKEEPDAMLTVAVKTMNTTDNNEFAPKNVKKTITFELKLSDKEVKAYTPMPLEKLVEKYCTTKSGMALSTNAEVKLTAAMTKYYYKREELSEKAFDELNSTGKVSKDTLNSIEKIKNELAVALEQSTNIKNGKMTVDAIEAPRTALLEKVETVRKEIALNKTKTVIRREEINNENNKNKETGKLPKIGKINFPEKTKQKTGQRAKVTDPTNVVVNTLKKNIQ